MRTDKVVCVCVWEEGDEVHVGGRCDCECVLSGWGRCVSVSCDVGWKTYE